MGINGCIKLGMFVDRLVEFQRGVNQKFERAGNGVDQFLHDERGSMRLNTQTVGDVIASIPIMMVPLAALAAVFTTNPELQNGLIFTAGISLVVMPSAVLLRVAR